ncbi:MAG: DUF1566 domain-containing protein [Silvanigrellales bacterium]|nr:DUF1566 domain-containing protein [Silvanigrellales bacterium]
MLTSAFAAASTNGLAAKVVAGQSVAGVAGSATARPADCALDGATGCVSTVGFPSVNLVSLTPSVLKKNVTVAGVTGDYPSAEFPLSGAHGATADLTSLDSNTAAGAYEFFDSAGTRYTGSISDAGSISVGTTSQTFNASLYRAFTVPGDANLVAGNISSGVSILGVEGSAAVRPGDCSTDGAVGCVTTATHKSAIITGLAAKVISTTSVAGETGTVVLPGASDVRLNVAYGPGSGSTGSYSPDFPDVANVSASDTVNGVSGNLSSCTMDGDTGCMVPASGSIKAADTSNFTGWDIRKKRNPSTGAVLTFAGLQTQNKTCRNTANRAVFNNTTAPADSAGVGVDSPDFFDTIDDNNNNLTGLPGEIPAWSIIKSTNYSTDFACGGIYATGDTTSGNTGADGAVAHNPNGIWQDLTPGILPGGANSSNTANGCNATDKHCVFRELISGLLVTEVSAATYAWYNSISYCHNLGEGGGVVTSPIPIIGGASYSDWRLPTQKELMHLYSAGIRSLNQTASLQTTFGNVSEWFWSSTSGSGSGNTFEVNISRGSSTLVTRDEVNPLVCVR